MTTGKLCLLPPERFVICVAHNHGKVVSRGATSMSNEGIYRAKRRQAMDGGKRAVVSLGQLIDGN